MGRKPHAESYLAHRQSGCENVPTSRSSLLHDLRAYQRTTLPLGGGELEQIQFLFGHASVQTTEHCLGCKQKLRHAVNDNLGLEGV